MITFRVHRYDPLASETITDAMFCAIEIIDPLPDTRERIILESIYDTDALKIFSALTNFLPGGTIDRLLILLLENRKSMLRVR